ncbi:hypothetical protein F0562_026764 [Nyssa sinensis]|uniref:Uncharacterized protein n=1 Tax=Nyssa sinensis TaxID=561372 RepID=A0A5J5BDV3_9ASTE|nr:hypothetical protein F0562_026764 [Nyssa sinensis]
MLQKAREPTDIVVEEDVVDIMVDKEVGATMDLGATMDIMQDEDGMRALSQIQTTEIHNMDVDVDVDEGEFLCWRIIFLRREKIASKSSSKPKFSTSIFLENLSFYESSMFLKKSPHSEQSTKQAVISNI